MPIPPRPHTYRCPACHWSKTVAPRSDALVYGIDYFPACPACGHSPLQTQAANPVQVSLAKLAEQIKLLIR